MRKKFSPTHDRRRPTRSRANFRHTQSFVGSVGKFGARNRPTSTAVLVAGGLVYIAGNESRLLSERMHHGRRQKQVHANNKKLLNNFGHVRAIEHVHGTKGSTDFTNGFMTWLKSNESTRKLAESKSVSEHEVQKDGLKSRACRSLSCWCARCIDLKVIKCHRACKLEEHRSKVSPKVMTWKGAQATLWMVLGGWGSG